jgi:hypothetical protein
MTGSTGVSRDAARPNVRAGQPHPRSGCESSQASRDTTLDLLDVLQQITDRAKQARAELAAGRAAGHQVNGTSALRQIELAARDAITNHLDQKDAR